MEKDGIASGEPEVSVAAEARPRSAAPLPRPATAPGRRGTRCHGDRHGARRAAPGASRAGRRRTVPSHSAVQCGTPQARTVRPRHVLTHDHHQGPRTRATSTPRSPSSTATRSPTPSSPSRVQVAGLDPWRLGGEMWGWYADGRLRSLCYAGANLVPICATPEAVRGFADRARRAGRRCSSIVGPAEATAQLWRLLEPSWGPAREVRAHQPLMVTDRAARRHRPRPATSAASARTRWTSIMPACVAMFTEEVGVSPLAGDGGLLYQARVAELVGAGRSFARIEDGKVVFKAEIGAATPQACQIQGVWVAPEHRGPRACPRPGMAAVLRYALARRRPGRQPVRQRLQHRGPRRLPPGRLPGGRRVHERAVLTVPEGAAPAGPRDRSGRRGRPTVPGTIPQPGADSRVRRMAAVSGGGARTPSVVVGPLDLAARVDEALAVQAVAFGLERRRDRRTPAHRAAPPRPTPAPAPSAPPPRTAGSSASSTACPTTAPTGGPPSSSPICARSGCDDWLDDSFVITELHVHPRLPEPRHRPRADHHASPTRADRAPLASSPPSTPTARPAASTARSATGTWPARCSSPALPGRTP